MPRTAWVLFAGTFVLRLGSFVFPFLALYLTKNGLSVTQAGLAITGYGVGAMLAQLSGGLLTDRIGRRNAIAISMITSAALVLLLLDARSLLAVLSVVIVYAFFAELHRPASGALIADLIPPEHRVAAYAFNRLLFNLSFAIGLAIGGLLAEEHFRELFIADAATSVVFGVISLVALPHGTRSTKEQDRADRERAGGDPRRQGASSSFWGRSSAVGSSTRRGTPPSRSGSATSGSRSACTGSSRARTASSSPSSSSGSPRSRCDTHGSA